MDSNKTKDFVIYASPAGTTRHVARVICATLQALGHRLKEIDLSNRDDSAEMDACIEDFTRDRFLWVGSPVYAGHEIPPILDFIARLPLSEGSYAVPFVTWGGVTSGVALYEMARVLCEKGYTVVGAAKVLAVHSLMWQFAHPLGEGHPDAEDDLMVENLVAAVNEKIESDTARPFPLEGLNYQPQEVQHSMRELSIEAARTLLPPRHLDKESCTQCARCEQECPAQAIRCDPFPHIQEGCFLCYNCVRLCEQHALKSDFSRFEGFLRKRAAQYAERPFSQIFV